MRKIILEVAVSLDGLIEGTNGEYDWCFTDQDYGMREFFKRIDTIFYGRKSYELMTREMGKSGKNPFGKKENYVFSNSLNRLEGAQLIGTNFVSRVNDIKKSSGKDIWLFGGASLTGSLINAGLVDEIRMAVHPLLLGIGKPLFQGILDRTQLRLVDAKTWSTGLVSMHYEITKPQVPISTIN